MLLSKFLRRKESDHLEHGLHLFVENAPVINSTDGILFRLGSKEFVIRAIDNTQVNLGFTESQIAAVQK